MRLLLSLVLAFVAIASCSNGSSDSGLSMGIEAPLTVKHGEDVYLGVFVRNESDEVITVQDIAVKPPIMAFSFRITDMDNRDVWQWQTQRSVRDHIILASGSEIGLETLARSNWESLIAGGEKVVWDQIDRNGDRVPAGKYVVHAEFTKTTDGKSEINIGAKQELTIRPQENQRIKPFKIALEIPEVIREGEPLPISLIVTNMTDKVIGNLGGEGGVDFLIVDSRGRKIWAWWYGRCCLDYGGGITLNPGESYDLQMFVESLMSERTASLLKEMKDGKLLWKQNDNLNNVIYPYVGADSVHEGYYFIRAGLDRLLLDELYSSSNSSGNYTRWHRFKIE